MNATQIYAEVNSLVKQGIGEIGLTAVDNTSLIAMGQTILASNTYTENFLNTLVQRIGLTILAGRTYRSMFDDLVLSNMEYGNIVQKITIDIIEAEEDESFDLTNGGTVDQYKIRKPDVTQSFFSTMTPYQLVVTFQKKQFKAAFLNSGAMESFMAKIYEVVQNSIEVKLESLGRNCLNNMIAEVSGTARAVNLLTTYNTLKGASLTVNSCKFDADFLRWAVGYIKLYSKKMRFMSKNFNDGSVAKHTSPEMQRLYVMADWQTTLETVVQYQAFNEEYVKLNGFKELPYLQSEDTPDAISVKRASDSATTSVTGFVACVFDRDALGLFKKDEEIATTPWNAGGLYANTFWHLIEMYFNDLTENFIYFYVAPAA